MPRTWTRSCSRPRRTRTRCSLLPRPRSSRTCPPRRCRTLTPRTRGTSTRRRPRSLREQIEHYFFALFNVHVVYRILYRNS